MKTLPALLLCFVALAGCREKEAEPTGSESMALEGLEDDNDASDFAVRSFAEAWSPAIFIASPCGCERTLLPLTDCC